ncbi:hypothetical protein GMORB2_2315 [Geosmithia morbida]|uniref:Tetratricopeptide repeat protein n=1 Tax=Geosmithia morbida TaxID=1094350 RepID=A0A9P5CZA4_9HYPO|nr:uncharacterized protein GMORB2_2315 [Geosmithia morbida]KAF4121353.1 hypothetical protein GMORB2_2315 [Geosmithia morbida]
MVRVPSARACTRSYATSPRSGARVGNDVWGEVHVSSITAESLGKVKASRPSFLRHEPNEYVDVLRNFSAISTRSGADWPLVLKGASRPSKEILNDLGCYTSELTLLGGPASRQPGADPIRGPVVYAMFSGASMLGCEASCVSLVRLIMADQRGVAFRPLFRPNVVRFRAIVRAGRNPFALATEGLWLLAQGKPNAAVRLVERALQIGGGDAFAWAAQCKLALGQARHALGEDGAALELLTAAAEAGQRDAWRWIGRLAPDEAGRRDAWFKGGIAGDAKSFDLLGDDYAARAQDETLDRKVQDELLAWSSEFKQMASRRMSVG